MDLGFDLNLEQKQQLIMTPRLQMAIELLQFSSLELKEYIDEELKENPLLERDSMEYDGKEGTDYAVNSEQEGVDYENFISYKPNLLEHLENQLYLVLKGDEIKIGKYIIGNLDEHGFLTIDLEEIARKLKQPFERVKSVLKRVQELDPAGIAADGIQEALLIQLDFLMLDTRLARIIIGEFFDDLTAQNYTKILKKINADKKQIKGAINLIKTLNPYPAAGFSRSEDIKYIAPDLTVKKIKGKFVIVSNENLSPVLRINKYYYNLLRKKSNEAREFLQKRYRSALWLIRSIEQRRLTIYRIAEAIIKKQEKFLYRGIKFMSPMTMQEIADMLDIHESTVSRATTEKYIQTPQGLFELKFFFNRGVNNLSSVSIKAIISDLIHEENPCKPLSDSAIVSLLRESRGVELSRRTVAKYRNEL
ncbi:MAG TPA: RNA polymerase factor sigma-54, partial [Halanaerobiales bacterium]|nr:RNA polymerase factor sigma-54 [Halanaerobiales bacterium]